MKGARIMLTVIGVFTLIGGNHAFKANHRSGSYYCTTTTNTTNPDGSPATCSQRATTGLMGDKIGHCTFGLPGAGTAYSMFTKWGLNQ